MHFDLIFKNALFKLSQEVMSDEWQPNALRGGNTPVFSQGNFIATQNSHCPRIAVFRSKYNISLDEDSKTDSDILSHLLGRLVEDKIRDKLALSIQDFGGTLKKEKEARVYYKDIYTASPDSFLHINDQVIPVEIKSVQSYTTAKAVIDGNPKCGAIAQISSLIFFSEHNVNFGYILYILPFYFNSIHPNYYIFETRLEKDGFIYVNGIKTLISKEEQIEGITYLHGMQENDKLPPRPLFKDVFGGEAKYSPCTYCNFNQVCDLADAIKIEKLSDILPYIERKK